MSTPASTPGSAPAVPAAVPAPSTSGLDRYTRAVNITMIVLALIYTATFSAQAILYQPEATWYVVFTWIGLVIWAAFAVDLVITFVLDPNKRTFLKRQWLSVITVVLPMFRALRILRIFSGGAWVSNKGNGILTRSAVTAAVGGTVLIVFIGSLMVLNAERGAKGATITSFGESVWWSMETITTVGYGDAYPVTVPGRFFAVGIMLLGISVLGVVTASVSAALVKRTNAGATQDQQQQALGELQTLIATVARLESQVAALTAERGGSPGTSPAAPPAADPAPSA